MDLLKWKLSLWTPLACPLTQQSIHPSSTDGFPSSIQALTIAQHLKGRNHSAPMDPLCDGTCANKVRTRPITAFSSKCLRWHKAHHDCQDHDQWQPCQHEKFTLQLEHVGKAAKTRTPLQDWPASFSVSCSLHESLQAAVFRIMLYVGPVVRTLRTSAVPGSANAKHAPQQTWSRENQGESGRLGTQIALVSSLVHSEWGVSKTLTILFSTCSLVTAPALDRLVVAMRHFWVVLRRWRTKLQSILHNWLKALQRIGKSATVNDDYLGFNPRLSCAASSCPICSPTLPSAQLFESPNSKPAKLQHLKQEQELESPAAKQQRSNHFGVLSFGQVNSSAEIARLSSYP